MERGVKALRAAAALRNLREQPLWRLLASTKAPVVTGLLQSLFMDADKALPSSYMLERVGRDIDTLRSSGETCRRHPRPMSLNGSVKVG
jgi:hypothetical protein